MPRGGFREGAGRKSEWVSSSKTTLIRVPSWMVEDVLNVAKQKDENPNINITENITQEKNNKISNIEEIIKSWREKSKGKEDSPRWRNLHLMIIEIEKELTDI